MKQYAKHNRLFSNSFEWIGFIVLLLIMYFPLFGHLGNLTIRMWDEARVCVNALEMKQSGNWLVTTYMQTPDTWNTKPPLLIWLQTSMLYLIDNMEIAIRLPSALAGAATIILLFFFLKKVTGNYLTAYIAAVVLLCSKGFVDIHSTRTGDYDALLVFFTTLSSFMLWQYLNRHQNRFLYLFFVSLGLGVLTKSISALLILPALAAFILYRQQFFQVLLNKHFYLGILLFVVITGTFYFLREKAAPGYLKAVGENELWGRYMQTLENHKHPFQFYYDEIRLHRFKAFYLMIPLGVLAGIFFQRKAEVKKLTIFATMFILSYFLIISSAGTKLKWYDLPMFPFFAILVSVFATSLLEGAIIMQNRFKTGKWISAAAIVILFVFLANQTYLTTQRWYKPQDYSWEWNSYRLAHYLRDATRGKYDLNEKFVLYDGYNTMLKPYIYQLKDQGVKIDIKDWTKLRAGDQVISYQPRILSHIATNFEVDTVHQVDEIITLKLLKKK